MNQTVPNMKNNELLFEVSQTLLEIYSLIHRNPILQREDGFNDVAGFNAEKIRELQQRVQDAWRASMKS